MDKEELVNCW